MFRKRTVLIGGAILVLITIFVTFIGTNVLYFALGNLPLYGIFNMNGDKTQYNKLNQVKEIVKKYYVEPVEDDKLMEGAAAGVAAAVDDPYTVYMDKKEYEDLMTQTHGSYAGIGVVVSVDPKDNLITVVAPFEDTPGEKAGILPGDKIVKVNGKDVWGDKLDEAVSMMKGPKNTEVTITIVRGNLSDFKEITIKRDIIVLQTVKHKIIGNDIGYIRITMFDEKTSKDFDAALDELYQKNIKGLIIDVRDNPGGLLDQVVKIADRLVPEGLVVYTEDRNKERSEEVSDAEQANVPMAVLVNGGSASASEILAGAIKDHRKGTLVGTKTFGKGLVQTVFPLGDGSAVKVTISKYYTPNGISIQGVGIQPDVEVVLPDELQKSVAQIKEEEDVQLQKAIEIVQSST
ncbi:S41 family peptidase [Petroclostridium sp. X23]|uniref:S41 family peptidase n=1 Tax=Petroclostridium sp. X23 TaxID=3045146 RepID=UPI0024ACC4E4|nr:S41 family peptidase [Petroclostridium sp. X23]WHH56872.1 S41 family peptidase [Petroclostridium sp. X23]